MQITAKNLNFVYSPKSKTLSVKALKDVSLTIKEGEFFGIIGKTGSGKSTFIQHLNGLIPAQENSQQLTVGQVDLLAKNPPYLQLRSQIGMVFQYPEYQLFAETVEEDVAFGIKNFMPQKSQEEKREMVKFALESVGLNYEQIKDKSPFELSGGQKRRVAIAGVIVTRPQVLVLDEPAAGLDPKGKREFLALLKKLHKDFIKTIIIVSHDMNLVAEHCTSVAVFKDGEVVATGTPKQVFANEKLVLECGLELPATARITKFLLEKGIKIDGDLTIKEFVLGLSSALKKGGNG